MVKIFIFYNQNISGLHLSHGSTPLMQCHNWHKFWQYIPHKLDFYMFCSIGWSSCSFLMDKCSTSFFCRVLLGLDVLSVETELQECDSLHGEVREADVHFKCVAWCWISLAASPNSSVNAGVFLASGCLLNNVVCNYSQQQYQEWRRTEPLDIVLSVCWPSSWHTFGPSCLLHPLSYCKMQ